MMPANCLRQCLGARRQSWETLPPRSPPKDSPTPSSVSASLIALTGVTPDPAGAPCFLPTFNLHRTAMFVF